MFAGFCCLKRDTDADPVMEDNALFDRQISRYTHGVRTQLDGSVPADKALAKLKDGNERFVIGTALETNFDAKHRKALAKHGQNPFATIIGCADSRCPIEILFDVQPGDIFVLRNAGNACMAAEGSIVGSVEYSVGHLHTNLVLVLGHTKCGAIAGATGIAMKNDGKQSGTHSNTLERLLHGLAPVAHKAMSEMPPGSSTEQVAAHAVKVNVFNTMEKLLEGSQDLRQRVSKGELTVEGAIYDIVSGEVDFIGPLPQNKVGDAGDTPEKSMGA